MLESRQRRLGYRPTPDGTEAIEEIMADIRPYQTRVAAGTRTDASIDEGLRAYMLKVYNLMGLGLVITGLAAFGTIMLATTGDPASAVATLPNGKMLTSFGLAHLRLAAEMGRHPGPARRRVLPVVQGQQAERIRPRRPRSGSIAALVGLSLSSIFLIYTSASIVQTFFVTAAAFGALSLYGYTTKRDLTAMGSFLIMGVFGLIIAMVVNIFLASSALQFAISAIGVLIFSGLTAYDTQNIKEMYFDGDDVLVAGRKAVIGALRLYLDFINLFTFLLQFLGNRE